MRLIYEHCSKLKQFIEGSYKKFMLLAIDPS